MLLDPKILSKLATIETTYEKLRFHTVASIPMEIAQTRAHYRGVPPEDADLAWQPVTAGGQWGDNGSSAWFRGTVTVPAECAGQPAFLRAQTGAGEALLLVDGVHRGVFDMFHPVRLLDLDSKADRTYQIHLEAYAGHTFPGTQPFDQALAVSGGASQDTGIEITKDCRTYGDVALVSERADVSAFVFDLRALRGLAQVLEENSLRRGRIQAALGQIFTQVFGKPEEVAEDQWRAGLHEARQVMQPLLALKNGPTSPFMGIIGHSHIDTAWLWTLGETNRKLARTFSSVLSLMDQYPEFKFTQSAAYHSDVVRQLYPEIFARIQQRVAEGRWEINGAMWIEPDCNIPGGEALVRQCLVGQRATREMFGVTSDTLWQPDVFGYSAALPQILQSCDVKYFCTTKLSWNDTNRFPYDSFVWQGIDGSTVLSHFNVIHCVPDPELLAGAWNAVQHKDVQDARLVTFGWGDGGGGPTAEMIEIGRRVQDLEGCPRTGYATISEFMGRLAAQEATLPRWNGELYLELHRGTLTSIAPIKRYNRKCEFALRSAEFAAVLARLRQGVPYPAAGLLAIWKQVLVNQFHDILPGSSIAEVNDEAIASFAHCYEAATTLRDTSLQTLTGGMPGMGALLLANDLSWERAGEIALTGVPTGQSPAGATGVQDMEDVGGDRSLLVTGLTVPALGYQTVSLTETAIPDRPSPFKKEGNTIETPFARLQFNAQGEMVSFFDLAARRELVQTGKAFNVLQLGEDVPLAWDNWDIDRDQRLKMHPQRALIRQEVVANGPLQMRLRQEFRIGKASTLIQDIVLHAQTPRVDFDTVVEWHEKYQFLKAAFSLDLLADSARHEIQFGHLTRSTHDNTSYDRAQFDVCAHKWTDISETQYGVAFLNDSKYACTVKNGTYQLSLLKSGRHPDARGDEGRHRFAYALLPHSGGFSVESVVRPAYEFNQPVTALPAGESTPAAFSLLSVDQPNVIVESVKWAEDNSHAFVVRLYEAGRTGTHVRLQFGIPIASVMETNMLEEKPQARVLDGDTLSLYLKAFEIKTLLCTPA